MSAQIDTKESFAFKYSDRGIFSHRYRLCRVLDSISGKNLASAIFKYIEHHGEKFYILPASIGFHHKCERGLVEHTLEVVWFCDRMVEIIQFETTPPRKLNRDVLIAAAILHDVGKVYQYEEDPTHPYEKTAFRYTKPRQPIDHATRVVSEFSDITGTMLPEDIVLCILSHEGGWAKTGVSPESIEAAILASADLISSRMESRGWS